MIPWDRCKAKQIASAPWTEDDVGYKRCDYACPTDFLSVRVYLRPETTRCMGLAYWYVSKNTTRIHFFYWQKPVLKKIFCIFFSTSFSGTSVSYFYDGLFSLVNNSCSFPNSRGFFNFLMWYNICICLIDLLLTTYAFCYNFQLGIQRRNRL